MKPHRHAYDRELDFLFGRINFEKKLPTGESPFQSRAMQRLMSWLGNPEQQIRTVHVAGTKGKGSVATIIARGLSDSGCRTGVYTSPHLETIRERIAVDDKLISEKELTHLLARLRPLVDEIDRLAESDESIRPPTFFEIITAAALLYFREMGVDWMILEVGLGGRLDSTNICRPDLCLITNISLDHTQQLGTTPSEIAREKAGIIKPGVPVICGVIEPTARRVIHEIATGQNAPIFQLGDDFSVDCLASKQIHFTGQLDNWTIQYRHLDVRLPGVHHQVNAGLAVAALQKLKSLEPRVSEDGLRSALKNTRLKARMELFSGEPQVVLDMAHNVASAHALADALPSLAPGWAEAIERVFIGAISSDKDVRGILNALIPHFDRLIFTKYVTNPRAYDAGKLVQLAREINANAGREAEIEAAETPELAWKMANRVDAVPPGQRCICIAGSVFLCAELRPTIRDAVRQPPSFAANPTAQLR